MSLRKQDSVRKAGRRLTEVVMLFYLSGFLLLAIRRNDITGYALAVGVPLIIWIGSTLLPMIFHVDSLMLALTNFLCALGVLLLYDTNPDYARQQVVWYGLGVLAMLVCIWAVRTFDFGRRAAWLLAFVSVGLLALPLVFGRETFGAKNWIYIAGVSFQPSEAVKLSLLIILARCMADRRFWPWFLVTLMLGFASTGSFFLLLAGILGAGGAAWAGYRLFAHVKKRVAIWRNPWAVYDTFGYQIVQGLIALASGGLMGVGLGLGSPTTIPVYESDFIFAVLCEQFGLIFALFVLAIVVALIWRGTTIAMAARTSFHGLLAMGATLMIGLQTFVIVGGVIKLIPLTGVTMPFVSYGGTSLLSSMCLVGLIQGVESLNRDDLAEDSRLALMAEEADA